MIRQRRHWAPAPVAGQRGLRLQPRHVIRHRVLRFDEIPQHGGQLLVAELPVHLFQPADDRTVEWVDQLGTRFDDLDQHHSTVGRIAPPYYEASVLETIDRGCRGARRQSGVSCQPASGGRAGEVQEIQTLQIGGIESDARRHQVADEDRLRAEATTKFVQCLEQLMTCAGTDVGRTACQRNSLNS